MAGSGGSWQRARWAVGSVQGALMHLLTGLVLAQNLLDMLLFKQFNPAVLGRCLCVLHLTSVPPCLLAAELEHSIDALTCT